MPRVSEEHLAGRRAQILDAARECFTRNGFHSTSMQDILSEAGMSAGAVYRYFPSKEAIIAAIAGDAVRALRAAFEGEDDVPVVELVARAVAAVERRMAVDDVGRLALQVWSEGARSEPLRRELSHAVRETRETLRRRLEPTHGPAARDVAAVIVSMLPGYVHARIIGGDIDAERYMHGVRVLLGDGSGREGPNPA